MNSRAVPQASTASTGSGVSCSGCQDGNARESLLSLSHRCRLSTKEPQLHPVPAVRHGSTGGERSCQGRARLSVADGVADWHHPGGCSAMLRKSPTMLRVQAGDHGELARGRLKDPVLRHVVARFVERTVGLPVRRGSLLIVLPNRILCSSLHGLLGRRAGLEPHHRRPLA